MPPILFYYSERHYIVFWPNCLEHRTMLTWCFTGGEKKIKQDHISSGEKSRTAYCTNCKLKAGSGSAVDSLSKVAPLLLLSINNAWNRIFFGVLDKHSWILRGHTCARECFCIFGCGDTTVAGRKSLTDGGAGADRVCSWFTVTAARVCGAEAVCHFRLVRGKVKTVTQRDTWGVKEPGYIFQPVIIKPQSCMWLKGTVWHFGKHASLLWLCPSCSQQQKEWRGKVESCLSVSALRIKPLFRLFTAGLELGYVQF